MQVIAQVTNSVRLANKQMTDLIGGVQKCLELALELSQSENPLSGDTVGSMNQIVGNVKQVSNELERISSVAVVGSSQSMDMMMVNIQKRTNKSGKFSYRALIRLKGHPKESAPIMSDTKLH